ncbi:MAG: hypothetical protein JNK74_19185 [Candidatus Hydrogenedentes bacterium]|nr:hypothetical protein [Candidatus Hydrogenedentota bacterium]
MSVALALLVGFAAALEVSQEPIAVVVKYPGMQQISLAPEDVMLYSEDIPQVETVNGAQVTYSQRSMTDMIAANVPEPPPESKPTLPNESRTKKRLDHTPPFNGTVTGDVSIIESAPDERIIVVSNIQGDGVLQVLVKGGTAKKATGAPAAAVVESPKVIVRNSKAATKVAVGGTAEPKAASAMSAPQKSSLEKHFKGALPENLKIVSEPITVK